MKYVYTKYFLNSNLFNILMVNLKKGIYIFNRRSYFTKLALLFVVLPFFNKFIFVYFITIFSVYVCTYFARFDLNMVISFEFSWSSFWMGLISNCVAGDECLSESAARGTRSEVSENWKVDFQFLPSRRQRFFSQLFLLLHIFQLLLYLFLFLNLSVWIWIHFFNLIN